MTLVKLKIAGDVDGINSLFFFLIMEEVWITCYLWCTEGNWATNQTTRGKWLYVN